MLPTAPNIAPDDLKELVSKCRPGPNYVKQYHVVQSNFNIAEWEAHSYIFKEDDPSLLDHIKFGFPVPYSHPSPPSVPFRNHTSALKNPGIVDEYVIKNVENGSLYGPFQSNPLDINVTVSPLQVSFSASGKPRVVVDCSWGSPSVNEGISDDWSSYPGYTGDFTLPSVDNLVSQILNTKKPVKLWKADLQSYYKQIMVDPGDIHYLAFIWRGSLYIDRSSPFGLRCSALSAQRITRAVCKIYFHLTKINIVGYIDDYACAVYDLLCEYSFDTYMQLTDKLGLVKQLPKCQRPADVMVILGLEADALHCILTIPQDKLIRIRNSLKEWLSKDRCSRPQLQSLLGVLNHLGSVVLAGRVFTARLLDALRAKTADDSICLDQDFHEDVKMWLHFLQDPQYHGKAFMKCADNAVIDEKLAIHVHNHVICIALHADPVCYKVASTHEFTDNELYVVAIWYVTRTVTFSPHDWVAVSVPTFVIQNTVNRAATENSVIRKLLRQACLIQAQQDYVIRAVRSSAASPLTRYCKECKDFAVIVV